MCDFTGWLLLHAFNHEFAGHLKHSCFWAKKVREELFFFLFFKLFSGSCSDNSLKWFSLFRRMQREITNGVTLREKSVKRRGKSSFICKLCVLFGFASVRLLDQQDFGFLFIPLL